MAAIDGMTIHRSSLKMPGTSWLCDSRFSAFRPGIHRAQHFLHGAWLTPLQEGFSRAIPLCFPGLPGENHPAETPNWREWEAALVFLNWLRGGLNRLGRKAQMLLVLVDSGFDVLDLLCDLPDNMVLLTRTTRNRALFYLPERDPHPGPGRPASYGDSTRAAWLSYARDLYFVRWAQLLLA